MITREELLKMHKCKWLLPEPGPEIIGSLIAEIMRLQDWMLEDMEDAVLFVREPEVTMSYKTEPKMKNAVGYCHKDCPAGTQDQAQHFSDRVECRNLGRHKEVGIGSICPVWAKQTAKTMRDAREKE